MGWWFWQIDLFDIISCAFILMYLNILSLMWAISFLRNTMAAVRGEPWFQAWDHILSLLASLISVSKLIFTFSKMSNNQPMIHYLRRGQAQSKKVDQVFESSNLFWFWLAHLLLDIESPLGQIQRQTQLGGERNRNQEFVFRFRQCRYKISGRKKPENL